MNSKEALETLGNVEVAVTTIKSGITHFKTLKQQYETEFEVLERELFIKKELKDFDVYQKRLEQLEKENSELLIKNERLDTRVVALEELCNINRKINDLTTKAVEENAKLKKALEKACERLDDDCPVSQELIDDLDCEKCDSNSKECWVKFFLKEELKNE